jgi:hypothetical protein
MESLVIVVVANCKVKSVLWTLGLALGSSVRGMECSYNEDILCVSNCKFFFPTGTFKGK